MRLLPVFLKLTSHISSVTITSLTPFSDIEAEELCDLENVEQSAFSAVRICFKNQLIKIFFSLIRKICTLQQFEIIFNAQNLNLL